MLGIKLNGLERSNILSCIGNNKIRLELRFRNNRFWMHLTNKGELLQFLIYMMPIFSVVMPCTKLVLPGNKVLAIKERSTPLALWQMEKDDMFGHKDRLVQQFPKSFSQ